MSRRNSYPGDRWNQRPGQAYSRTSGWPTRYYQRKTGGSIVAALAGLNTTSDDFAKKEGESPYLWNARLNGTKEARKRAQSMSRMGQRFFVMPEGAEVEHERIYDTIRIPITDQKSIKWKMSTTERITAVSLTFSFDETEVIDSNAHFVLILRDSSGSELCRAIRKVTALKNNTGEPEWFRFIRTAVGDIYLEASIIDDYYSDGSHAGVTVYVEAHGAANHLYAYHDLPNLDKSLREKPYDWQHGVSCPSVGYKTTNWESFPVWLQTQFFNAGGERYIPLGVKHDGIIEIYKVKYASVNQDTGQYDVVSDPTAELLISSDNLPADISQVRMTQAGNCLYFVDGVSPLKKVNLDTWEVSEAKPSLSDVDVFGFASNMYYYAGAIIIASEQGQPLHFQRCKEDFQSGDDFDQDNWEKLDDGESITAWPGASLIYFLNNRLFLSGFRHETVGDETLKAEPNLVIMSSITSIKPQYDMFNRDTEFFYVPDHAPSQSSHAPITAFSSIGDYLLIHTTDGLAIETVQAAVEFAGISQTIPEGSQFGVMKQEHVCIGSNNVFFYNPALGIMRTAGSTATLVSSPVDSIFAGLSEEAKANAHLCMTGDILRFYYTPKEEGGKNTQALIDYSTITQHRSYWFRDQNTPVMSTYIDLSVDLYFAQHSEIPCIMILDDTLTDFDCAILYEYYTKYIGTPDRLDHTIVRRIHVSTLQTYQSSVYIGLDYDHNNKPIVWRKFITPVAKGTYMPEDIFGDDEESGATNLDIRILTDDTRFVQIRLKQYCYDFQAEILQVGFEYANRTTL